MGPFALLWVAALALLQSVPEPEGLRSYSPAQFGVTAETPSRMPDSCKEKNRGRNSAIAPSVQQQAADPLDLAPDTGQPVRSRRIVSACILPGNAGLGQRAQLARN